MAQTIEEIAARFQAGETDLKPETAYLYQTQGEAAVLDFAQIGRAHV